MLPFYKIKKSCSSLHVMLLLVLVRCILSSSENYDCGVWIQIKPVFALDFDNTTTLFGPANAVYAMSVSGSSRQFMAYKSFSVILF